MLTHVIAGPVCSWGMKNEEEEEVATGDIGNTVVTTALPVISHQQMKSSNLQEDILRTCCIHLMLM